jgi:hypothetical protein
MMLIFFCSVVTQASEKAFTYSLHPTVLILVNEKLYPSVESNLSVFEQDLRVQGYDVADAVVRDGSSPPEVKDLIKSYYASSDLKGAILIGNISAAYSEMRTGDFSNPNAFKIWIALDATDMYYMDMDGHWENVTNPDIPGDIPSNVVECNLYDSCTTFKNQYIVYPDYQERWDYSKITNKEQYKAEIWVSRIMAYNLRTEESSASGWRNETLGSLTGTPPSLTIFSPVFNGLDVNINGVVFPGPPGTTIARISWDWGDGNSEDHWFASSHTYAKAGQYTITVSAYQSDGLNATQSNQIVLNPSPPECEAQMVNDYLRRDHDYRAGTLNTSSKVFILNSGPGYNDQGMDYSTIFDSIVENENVTREDFMNCVENPEGSQLLYLTAHSWPQGHALYNGYITTEDLQNMNKTSIVYILNACSACRWDQCVSEPDNPNYLGGLYIFDTSAYQDYGLCAMGFSGVGGFNNLMYFTDYLNANPGSSYAEAYKYWFSQNLMINFGPNNYVVLGDPTLQPNMNARTPISGDIDGDGNVGLPDLVILAVAYNSKPGDPNWNPKADLDNNSIVGLSDLVILATHYGQH